MKYLTLAAYLFSYSTGFAALGFTTVAWLRTRDRTFLYYLGFLVFFTLKMAIFNAEFFLEVFEASAALRSSAVNLTLVTLASAGFNAFLLLFLRSLPDRPWPRVQGVLLAAAAAGPLAAPGAAALWGNLWAYGVETAWDTAFLVGVTLTAWTDRPRARGPLFRQILTALGVLNLVYLPLALLKGLTDPWDHYNPAYPQLANGYYFAANLAVSVFLARHLFLAAPDPAAPEAAPPGPPPAFAADPDRLAAFEISAREAEVIVLLAEGLGNRAIGERLFIAPGTVKNHLYKIYQKTGVQNRVELLRLVGPGPNVTNGPSTIA